MRLLYPDPGAALTPGVTVTLQGDGNDPEDGPAACDELWNGTRCVSLYGTTCAGTNCDDAFERGQDCTVAFSACVRSE